MTEHYTGTEIELVPASEPLGERREYAVGIIDEIGGERFGHYADCGIVHTEERGDD